MTLAIRATKPIQPFGTGGEFANGFIYMRIDVLNNSGQAWVEFEFELQEILDQPSVFGDGLSFDQRNTTATTSGRAASPISAATSSPMTGCCFKKARSTRWRRRPSTS